jgi:peptidyl-prolyl cis-trans isomerase SurA
VKKQSDSTEIVLKQIAVPVPVLRDRAHISALQQAVGALRSNPGTCMDAVLPNNPMNATAKFTRTTLGALTDQQRVIVAHLEVGDTSEPLPSPDVVRLITLCEKIEPPLNNLPDADAVKQRLYDEKLELEAQKHLRDLKHDAFIDIKGDQ